MKKLMLMCCFLIGITAVSYAQNGMRMDPAQRAKMMQTQLKLSDDQTARITAILQTQATKRDSIRNAGGDREAMRPVMQATNAKIMDVLNDEQKAAYRKMMDEMRARMQNGGGNGTPPSN